MMEANNSCYCCPTPVVPNSNQPAMDLDSALNELGMLSTVTDSRKQFLVERERQNRKALFAPRGRNTSEPGLTGAGTPSNSPTKGVYQIVKLNSQFVTSLSTGLASCSRSVNIASSSSSSCCSSPSSRLKPDPINSTVKECLDFGEKYKQEELEQDARANRLSRLKIARVKRFRRPYELPWRRTLEHSYNSPTTPNPTVTASVLYNINPYQYLSVASPFLGATPEKCRPADKNCTSNASTPEKNSRACRLAGQQTCTVTRSKSLDDLDISKLQLAETENHNFIQERRDIDTVSEHLRDLHVQE